MRAITAGDVHVNLSTVYVALMDGSEAAYDEFIGSQCVRTVIENHVANRIYFVRSDEHRQKCFEVRV